MTRGQGRLFSWKMRGQLTDYSALDVANSLPTAPPFLRDQSPLIKNFPAINHSGASDLSSQESKLARPQYSSLIGCRDMNMKMFNWVQKKFNWVSDYHRVSNGKAPDIFVGEDEGKSDSRLVASGRRSNKTLRYSNILAIGTFNHSHRLSLNSTGKQYLQEEVKENDLRMVAMVRTADSLISSRYNPPSLLKSLQCKTSIKKIAEDDEDKKKMMELLMVEQVKYSNYELLQPLLKMGKERRKSTTLADLLAIEASLSRTVPCTS